MITNMQHPQTDEIMKELCDRSKQPLEILPLSTGLPRLLSVNQLQDLADLENRTTQILD
jgi:hypothetical protein